ncbi:MAG: protein kinase, partial [Planctomycetales bacterium]|nr:protein kinase [Planctomycetales bacterium]
GLHYLITEYVDGHDLDRTIKRDGPLSAHQAAECVLQAARGLAYAHQQQVIHRDIKPANLLLDTHGVVKILDMGLARLADEQEPLTSPAANLTESGMIMGTVSYMAPEQARNTKNADER